MYIYLITNKINSKQYVGLSTKQVDESINYYGSGQLILNAIRKYGKTNFIKEVLENCNNIEELAGREIHWIKEKNTKTPNGYNICGGGCGFLAGELNPFYGKTHSQEIKDKRIEKIKGHTVVKDNDGNTYWISVNDPRYLSGELVHVLKGTHLSEEAKQIQRDSHQGENASFYGKHHSDESKKILSEKSKGKVVVKDKEGNNLYVSVTDPRYLSGELISIHKGSKQSEETKKKISDHNKQHPIKYWLGKKQLPESIKKGADKRRGQKASEESKAKRRGKHLSDETKTLLSEKHLGKKHTEETKKKISDSHKGKPSWNKGKHMSDETKKKLSIARTGMKIGPRSEDHRKKISEANKGNQNWLGKKHSEETKKKMSETPYPEDGKRYMWDEENLSWQEINIGGI